MSVQFLSDLRPGGALRATRAPTGPGSLDVRVVAPAAPTTHAWPLRLLLELLGGPPWALAGDAVDEVSALVAFEDSGPAELA